MKLKGKKFADRDLFYLLHRSHEQQFVYDVVISGLMDLFLC